MSAFLYAAGATSAAMLVVHSVAGEILLMRPLWKVPAYPSARREELGKGTVQATWHVTSLLGGAIAFALFVFARKPALEQSDRVIVWAIAGAMFASSIYAGIATRLRHPGWIGFLVIAALCALGARG